MEHNEIIQMFFVNPDSRKAHCGNIVENFFPKYFKTERNFMLHQTFDIISW